MTPNLPWAPISGQTALRVIERSETFVLCEDRHSGAICYLFGLDGKPVSIGGRSLTLQARVMKPEPVAEIEPDPRRPAFEMVAPPAIAARATKKASKPKPAQMSLF
ncbi:hypothetical protein GJ654_18640 [Rhodoblastus acidophilus]|uniref:Uncharacterized protein n=1 Tax=Rhodoblastus acidophilus TaxID=1074 RepID=A0A6N8DV16_RHOAC|nr:hypothetical protein [Rhodoblastus acidophilus]MCW2276346.1 hypothetical protein [Rhodoblastus acidophilus]MTV33001.1 hypothetical protein [Rhodoblastus acidophilus]